MTCSWSIAVCALTLLVRPSQTQNTSASFNETSEFSRSPTVVGRKCRVFITYNDIISGVASLERARVQGFEKGPPFSHAQDSSSPIAMGPRALRDLHALLLHIIMQICIMQIKSYLIQATPPIRHTRDEYIHRRNQVINKTSTLLYT